MTQPVLIVGTGALATLFAARLSAAGARVTMLGTWKIGLEALRENGARLIETGETIRMEKIAVTRNPGECLGAQYAIVLVKAWQTERAAGQLAECLAEDGLALTLQNGLGNYEVLSRHLEKSRVALGVTTTGATLLGPGLARLGGEGVVSIEKHPRLAPLDGLLRAAGFKVQLVDDARSLAWGKLVINAAINPLTALLRVPNGQLLERPAARTVMASLAREAATVARKQGVWLPFKDPVGAAEEVVRKTAANYSSMLQDVKRGAPTEIDSICGAVVREGKHRGVPTPVNWAVWNLVRAVATHH
jgi:2-dehydropantoate 2-reductase